MKKGKVIRIIILIILAAALIISGFKLITTLSKLSGEKKQIEKLAEETEQGENLFEKNSDMICWLDIEGTEISYPVMYTPDDPEYYLHRDFDGEYSYSGMPFLDSRCDIDKSSNLIIYGHNMKTGKMFHDLLKYENESFYKNHKYIQFDTIYGNGTYEVIAAFRTHILTEKEDGFRYYQFFNAEDKSAFNQYVSGCKALTGYTIDTDASYGDSLLTLSTCAYHTDNGRFVVVAKKLTP